MSADADAAPAHVTSWTDGPRAGLYYELHGDAGSPVMLVMGLTMGGGAWRFQVPPLAERHRVAWFDHRGVGQSDPIDPAEVPRWSMDAMADDVLGLMDHLGWQAGVHLVGVSMGGMIAQHVALRARQRLRSLTLIATTPGGLLAVVPPLRGLQLFVRANRARGDDAIRALEGLLFPAEYIATEPNLVRDVILSDFGRPRPETRRAHIHAVRHHRTARRLGELAGLPTLIFRPGRDILVRPGQNDRLHRLIPGARLVRYDDAGHGVIRQRRDALNPELLAHFAAAERQAPD